MPGHLYYPLLRACYVPASISSASGIFTYLIFTTISMSFLLMSWFYTWGFQDTMRFSNSLVNARSIMPNPCSPALCYTALLCFASVPVSILLVSTNYRALFLRPHQFLPMCLLGWIQWLWISVSCHSCTAPWRRLWPTGFSRTEATRAIDTHSCRYECFKTLKTGSSISSLWHRQLKLWNLGISLKMFYFLPGVRVDKEISW